MAARLWLLALLFFSFATSVFTGSPASIPKLQVFVRWGCPYCAEAKRFLDELQGRLPELRIRVRDISQDAAAFQELHGLAEHAGITPVGVPAVCLRGELIIGFAGAEANGEAIEPLLNQQAVTGRSAIVERIAALHNHRRPSRRLQSLRHVGLIVSPVYAGQSARPKKMFLMGGAFVAVNVFL